MKLATLCPHFAPDTAPTGVVMTHIVEGLAERGHELAVVTALPWYRHHAVEPEFRGRWVRRTPTPWGRVVRDAAAAEDDRVEVVAHRRNLGPHASFNEGIDWARATLTHDAPVRPCGTIYAGPTSSISRTMSCGSTTTGRKPPKVRF